MGALLQFPERNKGRKRRSRFWTTMGDTAIRVFRERDMEVAPSVVSLGLPDRWRSRADEDESGEVRRSPELCIMLAIFASLPGEQQDNVRRVVEALSYDRSPAALAARRLLEEA